MRFADYWPEDDAPAGTTDLPLCPDGTHTGEIIQAKAKRLEFMKREGNADGACIVIVVDVPRSQPVETIIPATFRGKIEAVARAAGVPVPRRVDDWDEQQLVGRMVTIETVLAVSKNGKDYVRVEKWLPSPSQKIAPSKPAAAPARRPAPQPAGDDFPFALLLAIVSLIGGMA